MWNQWLQLIFMLLVILIASQLFTNALEYFGQRIKISTGVTGSIFAAIATALPETMVPIIAIVAGTSNKLINQQIGVGAILGSSLMLSTLSTFLLGLSAIKKRGLQGRIKPEKTGFRRDINFFLLSFSLAAIAMFVPYKPLYWRASISFALVCLYIIYLVVTIKASKTLVKNGHGVVINEPMIFTKFGLKNNTSTIIVQLIVGLILLLFGAKGFIDGVEGISLALNISALVLSLLIIPIATELPEKVNSIIWVRKNKDTLGFGNITGAMAFQGSILPALGILLTPWQPSREVLTCIIITFFASIWLRLNISIKGLLITALFMNGFLYLIYIFLIFV